MEPAKRSPFIVALYSDAPRAGKSTSAKVIERLAHEAGHAVDILSFAFPIRHAARQVLPASWPKEKVREHLSGHLKDTPIGELGGKTGRDLLKIIGNTVRSRVRDDLWADRLLEEIDALNGAPFPGPSDPWPVAGPTGPRGGGPGVVVIDDLRWPGEYLKLKERGAFLVRLVTENRIPADFNAETVDGLLTECSFNATVPAKGLVPQEALEKIIADLWHSKIARLADGA